ncbi:MAG: hypothetical protein J6J36_07015 [Clostridia bacterium]|nr:hypothetical protein [Clostridia bacterium]
MILKIGKGKSMPTQTFEYIENCEGVISHRMNLGRLLRIWVRRFGEQVSETSIQAFMQRQKVREENQTTCNVNEMFCRQLLELLYEELNIGTIDIADVNDLQYIVDSILGPEAINENTLNTIDLFGVEFINYGTTHFILSSNQPIYLLNNEGKTIDIIK